MKKSTPALAALVAAASLAGAATISAHASPAQHAATYHSSKVASVRLHALLETPGTTQHHRIHLDDWGAVSH